MSHLSGSVDKKPYLFSIEERQLHIGVGFAGGRYIRGTVIFLLAESEFFDPAEADCRLALGQPYDLNTLCRLGRFERDLCAVEDEQLSG